MFVKEIADKFIQENFLRVASAVLGFDELFSNFQCPGYTTTERDTLTPKVRMIIFNETTLKFQGYNGSSWVDFN